MGSDSVSKAKAEMGEEGGGGGFYWKAAHGINLHKMFCGPAIYALMVWYDCFTPAAWTYLALHGSYSLLWLAKEAVFPDKTFQKRESFTVPAASFIFCTLSYWSIPWILVAHARSIPSWYQCSTTALFCAGMFMMHVSDFQKTLTLKLAPGTLITTGFFKHVRHPNFLGEIIIYISFAMLTGTAWGFLPVIASLALVLLPSMSRVDKSLSRYPEFAAWEASTYHLIPFIY